MNSQVDPRGLFQTALREAASALGLGLDEASVQAMWAHYELLVEANRQFNLTRITAPQEAAVKHYADSLAAVAWAEQTGAVVRRMADIGTGAGLPALALAIVRPDWQITALDATGKKIRFVQRCVEHLGLGNVQPVHAHSHHWRPAERFDLVVARALGKLAACLQQVRWLVRPGTWILAYKTAAMPDDELAEGKAQATRMGLTGPDCWPYRLALGAERLDRMLVVFRRR